MRATAAHRDDDLVARLQQGEEAAFETLIEQHHAALRRTALAFVSTHASAEEVVQDTWVAVLGGLRSFEGRSSLKTWIFQILINRAKTKGAREARTVPVSAMPGDEERDPAAPPEGVDAETPKKLLLRKELAGELEAAMLDLPARTVTQEMPMFTSIQTLYGRAIHLLRKLDWAGPLLVRLTLGLVFLRTGWGKLHSLDDVTQFFESLNIPAPGIQATMVSIIEFGGGLLLIAGLGTRIVSALLIGVMTVAIWTAKLPDLHGVFDLAGTDEFAYLVMFVWLVVSGAGAVSLDRLIAGRGPAEPRVGVAA